MRPRLRATWNDKSDVLVQFQTDTPRVVITRQFNIDAETVRHPKKHAANVRFGKFLEKHLDDLFTFLRHPSADATTWRGEQAIRPAVVNRRVWGGNRTEVGTLAQSRMMSLMQACKQRLADPFDFICRQLTATRPLTMPLPILAR